MEKRLAPQGSARKMIIIWSLLIFAGVLAYGVGLYQGSQYRMQQRSIASEPLLTVEAPSQSEPTK